VHTWTIRAAALGVLSAAALIGASVGSPAGAAPAASADNGFGGPLAAHVVARPIERDLTPSTRLSLHSVPCAVPSATRSCFAAGR
jgi:hypothetical protein